MTEQHKRMAIVLALLATLALVWFAPASDDAGSEPVKTAPAASGPRTGKAARPVERPGAVPVLREERAPIDTAKVLFARGTWYVEPPAPKPVPPPPPPPPPPPQAPPLPYTFMGKYIEDGITQVILAKGNRVVTAVVGDVIDREYRVERIDPSAIVLMYLPLQQTQSVPTGSPQ